MLLGALEEGPCAAGAFGSGGGKGIGGGIAERHQYAPYSIGVTVGEGGECCEQGGFAEVAGAGGAIEAIEEGCDFDEFAAGVHEVQIECPFLGQGGDFRGGGCREVAHGRGGVEKREPEPDDSGSRFS